MVSKKLKGMLVAAAAGAMAIASVGAFAQAPAGGPGGGPPRGPGGGGGFAAPTDRAGVIQRYGLNAPELKLTDAQKAQIDKAADAYLEESKKVPQGQEGMQARQTARTNLTTAVGKVLNDEQRKTFDAAQAQRRPPGGPGGGPPGGGPGGPPGGTR